VPLKITITLGEIFSKWRDFYSIFIHTRAYVLFTAVLSLKRFPINTQPTRVQTRLKIWRLFKFFRNAFNNYNDNRLEMVNRSRRKIHNTECSTKSENHRRNTKNNVITLSLIRTIFIEIGLWFVTISVQFVIRKSTRRKILLTYVEKAWKKSYQMS